MKRFFTLVYLFAICLPLFAQVSIPQMDKAKGKRVVFDYDYSLSQNGGEFSNVTSGKATVEGDSYNIEGLGLQIISDGTTRWTLDSEAMEVVVENADEGNLLTNPALLITNYRRLGKSIQVKESKDDYLDVIYTVDENVKARFVIRQIQYFEPKGKSDFSYDLKSLSKDYLITDLR